MRQGKPAKGRIQMKRQGNLVLNEGDFGTIYAENDGTKFYLRVRSFVDIATGETPLIDRKTKQPLVDETGQPQRRQQKSLLATRDDRTYTSLKSKNLAIKAAELRSRIIAWEEAAVNGQTVSGDGTISQAPAPVAPNSDKTISAFFTETFIPAKRGLRDSGKLAAVTFETYQNYWDLFLSKHSTAR
jgi:hypothetical protein